MRPRWFAIALASACLLLAAGCSSTASGTGTNNTDGGSLPVIVATSIPADSSETASSSAASGGGGGGGSTQSSAKVTTSKSSVTDPGFPNPGDCVSYDPSKLTVAFNSTTMIYTVSAGSTAVARAYGNEGGEVGQQALALAQRYTKHCFIGRNNSREDPATYVFDYWPDASGKTPTIPDQEDACSQYNNKNLTVDEMSDNEGWRVKDHDDILHEFDTQADANNGKLVLLKYSHACQIGDSGGGSNPVLTYFLP